MFNFDIQRFTDPNTAVRFADFKTAMNRVGTELGKTIKGMTVEGNTVKFYNVPTAEVTSTTTVAATFDFPEELFLDQAKTQLVENFTFDSTTYPGATDPSLNGKTVLVLAVKGDKNTEKFSFVNLGKLIDTYTAADNTITISGYTVAVKISSAINNAIEIKSDGLHVDISGKIDKVTSATTGNIPAFDANGNLVDSGYTFSTASDTSTMLDEIFGA